MNSAVATRRVKGVGVLFPQIRGAAKAAVAGARMDAVRLSGTYEAAGTRGRGSNPVDYSLPATGPVARRVLYDKLHAN